MAGERRKQCPRQPRHRRDSCRQQQPDRAIAEQCYASHGRHQREAYPDEGQQQRRRDAWPATRIDRVAEILERQQGRHPRCFICRQQATDQRGRDAKRREAYRRAGHEQQPRRAFAREVAATEVATDQPQHRRGEGEAEQDADHASDHAEDESLGQQLRQQQPSGGSQHAQKRKVRPSPRDRQCLCRIDEEGAGQQSDQRQHVEIDPIGAR